MVGDQRMDIISAVAEMLAACFVATRTCSEFVPFPFLIFGRINILVFFKECSKLKGVIDEKYGGSYL